MYKIFLWNGSTFVISRIYWIMQIQTLQIGLICSHGIVSNGRKEHSKPYIDISNAHFMVHLKRIHVDEINKNSFIVLIPF